MMKKSILKNLILEKLNQMMIPLFLIKMKRLKKKMIIKKRKILNQKKNLKLSKNQKENNKKWKYNNKLQQLD